MSNLKYSFTKQQTPEGNFVFRCEIDSFGLKNITDKDIVSFYKKLSNMSYFDSGLLPVSGSGLLSLRHAANHTQIVYQHAPSINYINWGRYEGDNAATAYYVAQPYRIVIADLIDDNFYGARIFYSPYPVTYSDAPLYHVNLPNINCRGYRGNGVGWVCLYHTTDISSFPFSEKLAHVLERCSGVEAYNDQNMSETDGPRFYRDHYSNNSDFSHLWNPEDWQNFTESHGLDWVINPDLWIPIKVADIDDQGCHDNSGVPLTISMAMLGNYQAYYTDKLIPKPVNAIARFPDKFNNTHVENLFKVAFNSSSTSNTVTNVYSDSVDIKKNLINNPLLSFGNSEEENNEEESDNTFVCYDCNNTYNADHQDMYVDPKDFNIQYCEPCFHENFVFLESTDEYVSFNNPNLLFDTYSELYFLNNDPNTKFITCTCGNHFSSYSLNYITIDSIPVYNSLENDTKCCFFCFDNTSVHNCSFCDNKIPDPSEYKVNKIITDSQSSNYVCNSCFSKISYQHKNRIINNDFSLDFNTFCLCGSSCLFSSMFKNVYSYNFTPSSSTNYYKSYNNFHKKFLTSDHFEFFYDLDNHKYFSFISQETLMYSILNVLYLCPSCYDENLKILSTSENIYDFQNNHRHFIDQKISDLFNQLNKDNFHYFKNILENTMSFSLRV
jgi:hypothetical protein